MKQPIPVSVYIITLNEEKNLQGLLPRLAGFAEVIVVDSGSKDRTVEIARQHANVKTSYREWSGFGDQKAHALSLCQQEWVLNLDADEELTTGYLKELQELVATGEYDALESRRSLLRWGRKPKGFIRDDVLIRLFKKQCGHYQKARVHEKITINGRIRTTQEKILHHENLTFTQRTQKSNQYSQLKAEDKFARGDKSSILHLVLIFPLSFLQCFLGKGYFLDGGDGVITSMNFAYYNFMKYAKLWEMWRQTDRATDLSPAKVATAP